MTDVKRWIDDGAPDAVRTLFAAAQEERPAPRGVERALVALGIGSAVLTGGAEAGATAALAAKVASGGTALIAAKWSLIGAVAAVGTFGTAYGVRAALGPAVPAAVRAAPARVVEAPVSAPASLLAETPASLPETAVADLPEAPVAPNVARAAAPAVPPPPATPFSVDSPRMLEEVRAIDWARSALSRGDARGTLSAVQAYGALFPEQRFAPEALFLRMEALLRLGDRPAAHDEARRLLATYPNAPQVARARRVLGGEN